MNQNLRSCIPVGSDWNRSSCKRVLDAVGAALLLLVMLPWMVLIGLAIKANSDGPVLFRQTRVGTNGTHFQILKFRSMFHQSTPGPGLTCKFDSRVTRIGRFLRKWKLDELPQLFNVLWGQMSLVGPRADLPQYMEGLSPTDAQVLSLRPGLTGIASLYFRNEQELLVGGSPQERERFYLANILPKKIGLELEYARRATFGGDFAILIRTLLAVLSGPSPAPTLPILTNQGSGTEDSNRLC